MMSVGIPSPSAMSPVARTLFVDGTNGNDATGERGRQDKPYVSISAAKADASMGDTVHVRAGRYQEEGLCKAGWHARLTGNVVRTSNVVTLTVASHPFAAGDTFFVTGTGVPASGNPFDGIWTVSATTSTTISYVQPGEDESAAAGSLAFAVGRLHYHFEGQSVVGYTSGTQRSAAIFGDVAGSTPTWTVVTGGALLAHTYAPIRLTVCGTRLDLGCFGVRSVRDDTTTNEAITVGDTSNGGVTFNATIFDDVYSARYDALIVQGVTMCNVKCRRLIAGDFEDNGGGYGTFGTGANGLEITGNNTDIRVECDDILAIDAAVCLATGTTTRGYVKVNGRIASLRTATTNVTPAISADIGFYHGSTFVHNITFDAHEISSASTNAVTLTSGLRIKGARIVSTRNNATQGAAVAFRGTQPDFESPVALTVPAPYPVLEHCTLVSHASANFSIQSLNTASSTGASTDNTIRIHGTVVANKAVQTPSSGVEGVNQKVGTVTVSADVV